MSTSSDENATADQGQRTRKGPGHLIGRTLSKAWEGNIFSESAEAAFWQALSLAPLMLGLFGILGYLGDWTSRVVVDQVSEEIITFAKKIFSEEVVTNIVSPTVESMLTDGKGAIASIGFIIALWAGSSAMSSFVDAITVAHDQYGVRNEVWQRFFSLLLYVASLVLLIVLLPLLAIGPDLLPEFFPDRWRPVIATWVGWLYYPALGVLLVVGLATLYKLALPRKLPWHRGLPGSILAMAIFMLTSSGLRFYLSGLAATGYTYGALATPVAFLLFLYFIGLAIVGGAYFNSAIQEIWPAKPTRRQRRKWRRLEYERANEVFHSEDRPKLWERTTAPLRRKKPAEDAAEEPTQDGATRPVATGDQEDAAPAAKAGDTDGKADQRGVRPSSTEAPSPRGESLPARSQSLSSPPRGMPS